MDVECEGLTLKNLGDAHNLYCTHSFCSILSFLVIISRLAWAPGLERARSF